MNREQFYSGVAGKSKEIVCNPFRLLSPKRFDIAFKVLAGCMLERGIEDDWALAPYEHHLKIWNGLKELSPPKDGLQDFVDSFKVTLKSISENGYDSSLAPIPVDDVYFAPLNGAHRLAASIIHNQPVNCTAINYEKNLWAGCHCDFYFLKNRGTGLEEKYSDQAAFQYIKLRDDIRIAVVFPSAKGEDATVRNIISSHGSILYEKHFEFNDQAAFNFVRSLYGEDASKGNPWLGGPENNWAGAQSKKALCFTEPGPVRVYWFEEISPEATANLKQTIRDLFGVGKHSVHTSDSYSETVIASGYLLNPNGIHFLSNAKMEMYQNFEALLEKFKMWLVHNSLNPDDFCVDSSAILSAYGLRDCRDLDFLFFGTDSVTGMDDVSCHNEEMKYYQHSKNEIIYNPEHHFYYKGVKFTTLNVLYQMKKFRGEQKDVVDCALIESVT